MDKLKKVALIILFLAVVGGVGFGLYTLFFGVPTTDVTPPDVIDVGDGVVGDGLPSSGGFIPGETVTPDGDLPTNELVPSGASKVAAGGLTQIQPVEEVPTLSPTLSPSGSLSYYNQDDGRFYTLDQNGNPILLSNKKFLGARDVTWSPGTEKAIIEFPDDSKVIFDFETEEQVTLPNHWEDFSFANDGESFAAKTLGRDPENQWLITVNSDGSNAKLVEHLGDNADKVIVSVSPNNSVVAISDTGDAVGFDTREMILIGQNNENFKAMRVEGFNFEPLWSPTGNHMLYSAASSENSYKPTLWFVAASGDAIGQGRTNLGLETYAHKCTFADAVTVFCAVPDFLPDGIGLQPNFVQPGGDSIFRVDLQEGRTTLIGKPEGDTAISSIVVSEDGRTLFMQSSVTSTLSQMRLK